MDAPNIAATEDTPLVKFDSEDRSLTIRGNSFPENTFVFYKPIISWLECYLASDLPGVFVLNMDIGYYNSSSSKVYMNIFNLLNNKGTEGCAIVVNWYCDNEDEDAHEDGEEFRMGMESITFNIVSKDLS